MRCTFARNMQKLIEHAKAKCAKAEYANDNLNRLKLIVSALNLQQLIEYAKAEHGKADLNMRKLNMLEQI